MTITTKKCYSGCRKKSYNDCGDDTKCAFITGKTRKYCKLDKKFKMDKSQNCKVIKKNITKKNTSNYGINNQFKNSLIKPTYKKCFSECRKQTHNDCNINSKCSFINGKMHKYCKLDKKFKMDKTRKCKVIKKIKKKDGAVIISKFMKKYATRKRNKLNDADAGVRIHKFMKNTEIKRTGKFLQNICSDSGHCLSFGTEKNKINTFFNNFNTFEYAGGLAKPMGNPSVNGFIFEIPYKKYNYNSLAVLKSAINNNSDNLMYEYQVGKEFINKQNTIYPCFLETYGLYNYADSKYHNLLQNFALHKKSIQMGFLKEMVEIIKTPDYKIGCTKSKLIALLIQHVKGSITLGDFMDNSYTTINQVNILFNYEMIPILFQVYMPLYMLRDKFTHYDLHLDNLMVYKPDKNKYIHYHYSNKQIGNETPKVAEFFSQYIVKIIDYGRSYFKNDKIDSNNVKNTICNEPECNPMCGTKSGLARLSDKPVAVRSYITPSISNQSHDVRLLNEVIHSYKYIKKHNHGTSNSMMNELVSLVNYTGKHGTKENLSRGGKTAINNVTDAYKVLKHMVRHIYDPSYTTSIYNMNNSMVKNHFDKMEKMGDMYIYGDGRPMKYVPAK
jgi:hypothetical protein